MRVTGVQRYDPVLVPRLARLAPGSIYDQDEVVQAQLRLAGSGYFDSAFVYVDPQGEKLQDGTVRARLIKYEEANKLYG